jgi:diguanylate cyclase (GGDEF)-like protein/PAS domain S-box-containing protein
MNPAKVLIIDDSAEIVDMLTTLLRRDGIESASAASGAEGIELARAGGFDLVLLDLGLPDGDGFEVCRRLKAIPLLKSLPIIMLTGRDSVTDKVRAFELGAVDYLDKGGELAELQARIVAALRRKQSRDRAAEATHQERERTQAELLRIGKAVDCASDAICIVDSAGRATYVNRAFSELFGLSLEAMTEPGCQQRLFARPEIWDGICDTCLVGLSWSGEVEMWARDRRLAPVLCRADAIFDDRTSLLGVVFLYTDITQRKRLEQDLLYIANHDPLTGLCNRRQFGEFLQDALARARQGVSSYLLYLDLDNFKVVNEAVGHQAGDRMLVEMAELLRQHTCTSDRVSRFGGDEFTVLLPDVDEAQATRVAEHLLGALDRYRFREQGRVFALSASIGITRLDGASPVEDLLSQADSACHWAKTRGRNGYEVFRHDNQEIQALVREAAQSIRLRDALQERRLELWLQPVVALRPEVTSYCEVLLRLRERDGQIVLPGEFLPAAQRFGQMLRLDRFVLESAFALMASHAPFALSVNLSAKSLNDAALPDRVAHGLAETKVDASRVSFEVTETDFIQNLAQARQLIVAIQRLGCHFALDDFGSGASSMLYLRDLPVNILKVDGSFIRKIDQDPINRVLVKSMADVAHALGMKAVAEYVCSAEVLQVVRELGIDYAQGWHVCPPSPPAVFAQQGLPVLYTTSEITPREGTQPATPCGPAAPSRRSGL